MTPAKDRQGRSPAPSVAAIGARHRPGVAEVVARHARGLPRPLRETFTLVVADIVAARGTVTEAEAAAAGAAERARSLGRLASRWAR